MVRTVADSIIAGAILLLALTGLAGLLFTRVREAVLTRALGGVWSRITAGERAEEQRRKIELISQEAMAKQAVMYKERDLRESAARKDRVRAAHDQLTKSYAKLAAYAAANPGSYTVDAVADARQAAAQLRVECPELADPLNQISLSLQSPRNLSPRRAYELITQVSEGVEKHIRLDTT